MKTIEEINQHNVKKILSEKKIPNFFPGDVVKVGVRITEGKKERIQYFEGVCIAKKSRDLNSSFTVRKISFGEGVERTFPLYGTLIDTIKVIRSGKVRRAKLYYLRDRTGKSARIAEKIRKKIGIDIDVKPETVTEENLAPVSKESETFGKGNVDGVLAPESANNAASTGSMLPMLTLGIPGSPTTAILLGGMVIWGLEPGPLLFVDHTEFVWGLIASLYAANFFALVINIAFIPAFIAVLKLPFTILAPVIFALCIIGGYVPTQDMHDVWLMLIFGIVGYLMRKLDYPLAPAVLAIVLGPIAEPAMRQSLIASHGDLLVFFTRPISGSIMIVAIILLILPLLKLLKNKYKLKEV